jgi:large subunit ribosomal protein L18e
MVSNTKIKKHLKGKTNPKIVDTINAARKNKSWVKIAAMIAGPARKYPSFNLDQISEKSKDGDSILIAGKVLGTGELSKKIKICALSFSSSALEKLKKAKIEASFIEDEIKSNPKFEGIKILQ